MKLQDALTSAKAFIDQHERDAHWARGPQQRAEHEEQADVLLTLTEAIEAMESDLQYFRNSSNLAFYEQGLRDARALAAVREVVESNSPCGEDVPAAPLRKAMRSTDG